MDKKVVISVDPKSLTTTARRRMRTSREETVILEGFYNKTPNPTTEQKEEIAKVVNMGARNVHFWFQNRRAKDNKKRKMLQLRQKQPVQQSQPQQIAETISQDRTSSSTELKGNSKYNLPPISTIMTEDIIDLSIPFYFHHSLFGIENCMIQLSKNNNNDNGSKY